LIKKQPLKTKIFESEEAQDALETIQVTGEEYKEVMKVNQEHEKTVKGLMNEGKDYQKNQKRLQDIYKVQAIGNALKNKVIMEGPSIPETLPPSEE